MERREQQKGNRERQKKRTEVSAAREREGRGGERD